VKEPKESNNSKQLQQCKDKSIIVGGVCCGTIHGLFEFKKIQL
jgi:hypothetical protein